jgi:flagellar biosynthesis protein FlhG
VTDAYALMKVLSTRYQERRFRLLVSQARSASEGRDVYRTLSLVTDRFLNVSLDFLGSIPSDLRLRDAVRRQRALVELFPQSPAGQAFVKLAQDIVDMPPPAGVKGGLQFFWRSLLRKETP